MTQDFSRYYYDYTKGDFMQLGSNLNTNLAGGADGMFQYAISYIASWTTSVRSASTLRRPIFTRITPMSS